MCNFTFRTYVREISLRSSPEQMTLLKFTTSIFPIMEYSLDFIFENNLPGMDLNILFHDLFEKICPFMFSF